jgi:hypothetical protein
MDDASKSGIFASPDGKSADLLKSLNRIPI